MRDFTGCERIYSEKASGKSTNGRPEFGKLMKALLPGDAVVVTKLDWLARSSRDLHNIIGGLQERGCGFLAIAGATRRPTWAAGCRPKDEQATVGTPDFDASRSTEALSAP